MLYRSSLYITLLQAGSRAAVVIYPTSDRFLLSLFHCVILT